MRFCLVSAEIIDPIFSGNGVASRSVARCLLSRPGDSLLVVCGRPAEILSCVCPRVAISRASLKPPSSPRSSLAPEPSIGRGMCEEGGLSRAPLLRRWAMTCPLTPDVTSCRAQERAIGAGSCADLSVERVDAELAAAIGITNEQAFSSSDGQTPSSAPVSSHPRLSGYAVRLPVWGKTDRSSSWREFALGASCPEVRAAVDEERVDVLVYVDWTGHNAAAALLELCPVERRPARLVFFSFCIFSALWGLPADDVAFYRAQEASALAGAHVVLCLCPKDRDLLLAAAALHTPGTSSSHTRTTSSPPAAHPKMDAHPKLEDMHPKIDNTHPTIEEFHAKIEVPLVDRLHVLLPPLRQDMFQLAAAHDPWAPCTRADCQFQEKQNSGGEGGGEKGQGGGGRWQRSLVVCCLRQVEAKNVLLFSEAMAELQTVTLMRAQGLTPYLCGAAGDVEYADACRRTLEEAYPGSTGAGFLGAHELAHVMQHALLNVHTSPYEAYGMTIVEAAAFGVPTLMHVRDIGASELLPPAPDTDPPTPTQRQTDTDSDIREMGGVGRGCGGEGGGEGRRGGGEGAAGESSLVVDMSGSAAPVAACLRQVLQDTLRLRAVGMEARRRALQWDEAAFASVLLRRIGSSVT